MIKNWKKTAAFTSVIDIILSFSGLIALSPVFAVTALSIKVEDPGPVFFTQKRVGQNKEDFMLHKFRSMKMCTPHDVPTHMFDNPDQYITKTGRFIRKYSFDELPQIWDIYVGNMSVIGPRPSLWNQDLLTSEREKYGANISILLWNYISVSADCWSEIVYIQYSSDNSNDIEYGIFC